MASEENKAVRPSKSLTIEQLADSGANRKRGHPRQYEDTINEHELPHMVQPIQYAPPLRTSLDGSNIRYDGLQIKHTSGGSVDPKRRIIHALPEAHKTQGDRSGGPRDSINVLKAYDNPASSRSNAHAQGNSGKDIVGKHFIGKMTKKSPGFSLITVKVNDNQVLKGWVLDENNLRSITPKDDLAPDLPILRPSQVQKRALPIHVQAPPSQVHSEDVTLAEPLQMRRPVGKSIATYTIPSIQRPYIGSGFVAATPLTVTSGNAESRASPKHGTESVSKDSLASAVPVKSAQPVLISHKQVGNQGLVVEGKSISGVRKDSESSNRDQESSGKAEKFNALLDVVMRESPGERKLLDVPVMDAVKESSRQIQHDRTTVPYDMEIASGPRGQTNAVGSKQQILKETPEQSGQKKDED